MAAVPAPRFRFRFPATPRTATPSRPSPRRDWRQRRSIPKCNRRAGAGPLMLCPRYALVMITRSLVSIVDDDESVRESLPDLLRQFGFAARAFGSAEAFLASEFVDQTRCLLLDIAMPGMSGPDLQRELAKRQQLIPIIFITASRDGAIRSRLLAEGAVECLFKPFSETS